MTVVSQVADGLEVRGFITRPGSNDEERWFERGALRVVRNNDDDEPTELYVFTNRDRSTLAWSASFSGGCPVFVVLDAIQAAIESTGP